MGGSVLQKLKVVYSSLVRCGEGGCEGGEGDLRGLSIGGN